MGEAKRRADAYASATPRPPPRVCPKCKSIRIERTRLPATGSSVRETAYDLCRQCGTVWEAYPDDWCEDVVGATPCDNCAFRPGSPEQSDPEGWRNLVALLKSGQEFRCHKGAPILGLLKQPPKTEFDAAWVKKHGRKCAGFMQMVWAMNAKGEDWLARHCEFIGAPGYDLSTANQGRKTMPDLLGEMTADDLPAGEYAIVEFMGHVTLVGRITEVERFGAKMLAIEPLFNKTLLQVIFHGGASIYRLTPCSAQVAWDRQPTQRYELPPTIFATVPAAALPFEGSGVPPHSPFHDSDLDEEERPF